MFFKGVGTATPDGRFSQLDCFDVLKSSETFANLRTQSRSLLERILCTSNGIERRSLALTDLRDAFQLDPNVLHQRFIKNAPALAERAARAAMERAAIDAGDIDAVVISTCTGYVCPGLSSYVTERLQLRPDVIPLDLVGQGCGAALPNFRVAEAFLQAGQAKNVLSICVEICSAAFYLNDDPGVLISACLFGDGAGAAVLSLEAPAGRAIEWISSETLTNPADRDLLRFRHENGLLINVLSPKVPRLAADYAAEVLGTVLERCALSQKDIVGWLWHAGGKNVLDALQAKLDLDDTAVRHSRQVLNDYGNMSSAFVYFVMRAALDADTSPGWWWMSSFGAGFTCHGALLKVA
jgi:polyketide synthase Type III